MENFVSNRRAQSSMRPMLLAAAGSFALGAAIVGYFAWRMDSGEETAQATSGEPQAALTVLVRVIVSNMSHPAK